jgi:hypothetical protein
LAKSLDEILQEIDAGYNPQRQAIQTRLDALPVQADAEIAGLNATKDQAFSDILGGARDRGMGFSGVPLAEQSRYTASTFLPAVARVRQSQNESRQSLFDALNNINLDKTKFGQSLYQAGLDREEQQRQFNAQLEAQRRAAAQQNATFGGLFDPKAGTTQSPLSLQGATLKNAQAGGAGGYNFSFGGRPISAVGFAGVNNLNPADVLYSMANSGDTYAATAYKEIVNNGGKITPQLAQKYSSLFWGTNFIPQLTAAKSASKAVTPAQSIKNNQAKPLDSLIFGGK